MNSNNLFSRFRLKQVLPPIENLAVANLKRALTYYEEDHNETWEDFASYYKSWKLQFSRFLHIKFEFADNYVSAAEK